MRETNIVNLTNQTIKLYPDEYSDIEIPVSKKDEEKVLARCIDIPVSGHARSQITRDTESGHIIGGTKKKVTLSYSHIGVITGLKPEKEGTIYIVSQLTYNAIYHTRKDIYIIDKPIRSVNGGVIGCRGFSRLVYDKDNEQLNLIDKYLKKRFGQVAAGLEADELANCIYSLTEYRKK